MTKRNFSPRRLAALGGLFLMLCLPLSVQAATYYVDDSASCPGSGTSQAPYCEIKSAIDAAANGDEVYVLPGTYTGANNMPIFGGKAITVRSYDNGNYNAAGTIIDGENVAGRVCVQFVNGETNSSQIVGFTIKRGKTGTWEYGSGIKCVNSSPTISGNIIIENVVKGHYAFGGGIYSSGGSPKITGNTIKNNQVLRDDNDGQSFDHLYGGGIYCENGSSPEITDNTIKSNVVNTVNGSNDSVYESYGGGIYCKNNTNVTIYNNIITSNTLHGKISSYGEPITQGGGIYLLSEGTISSNTIKYNLVKGYLASGGGVYSENGSPKIKYNQISNNRSTPESNNGYLFTGGGGGIHCKNALPEITENLISANIVDNQGFGGGVYIRTGSTTKFYISGNTITYNSGSAEYGGGLHVDDAKFDCRNNLINNNYTNGIHIGSVQGCCDFYNNIIAYNTGTGVSASQDGTQSLNFYHNTIYYNTGYGLWMLNAYYGSHYIKNSILWGNHGTTSGNQVKIDSYQSNVHVSFSDISNVNSGYTNDGDNLNETPQLDSYYKLQSDSPCIDRGTNLGIITDIDSVYDHTTKTYGTTRPDDDPNHTNYSTAYDIGADEFIH